MLFTLKLLDRWSEYHFLNAAQPNGVQFFGLFPSVGCHHFVREAPEEIDGELLHDRRRRVLIGERKELQTIVGRHPISEVSFTLFSQLFQQIFIGSRPKAGGHFFHRSTRHSAGVDETKDFLEHFRIDVWNVQVTQWTILKHGSKDRTPDGQNDLVGFKRPSANVENEVAQLHVFEESLKLGANQNVAVPEQLVLMGTNRLAGQHSRLQESFNFAVNGQTSVCMQIQSAIRLRQPFLIDAINQMRHVTIDRQDSLVQEDPLSFAVDDSNFDSNRSVSLVCYDVTGRRRMALAIRQAESECVVFPNQVQAYF